MECRVMLNDKLITFEEFYKNNMPLDGYHHAPSVDKEIPVNFGGVKRNFLGFAYIVDGPVSKFVSWLNDFLKNKNINIYENASVYQPCYLSRYF